MNVIRGLGFFLGCMLIWGLVWGNISYHLAPFGNSENSGLIEGFISIIAMVIIAFITRDRYSKRKNKE